ncbi:MAG: tetratricopeptide repeat protein [Deferribacterales bacterium]
MNIYTIKHNKLAFTALLLALFLLPATVFCAETAQEREDRRISEQIRKTPSPLLYERLAVLRAGTAADAYAEWRRNKKTASLQKAIYNAASACELSPQWSKPKVLLAEIYSEFSADKASLELAVNLLIQAAELDPANAPARLLLAQNLMKLGRFWSAIEVYKQLFDESETMVTGINTAPLALCYVMDGRVKAGADYFGLLRTKYPDKNGVAIALAVLKRHAGEKQVAKKLLNIKSKDKAEADYIQTLLKQWDREDADEKR